VHVNSIALLQNQIQTCIIKRMCDWHQIWMTNWIQSTHQQNFVILNWKDVKRVNWMRQSPTWHHFKHFCYQAILNWIDFHPQWQS
jgi:hypothetical protein